MKYPVIALLCLLANAASVSLDPKYCINQETYYSIYQVPTHNCDCEAKQAGALRYHEGNLQVCNGKEYVDVCANNRASVPEVGSAENAGKSCRDIISRREGAKSGMYYIKNGDKKIKTYCYMEEMCGGKGWTMIMKIDGNKKTFRYDSAYWSNKETHNPSEATGGLRQVETKLSTYSDFAFTKLCLGMRTGNTVK